MIVETDRLRNFLQLDPRTIPTPHALAVILEPLGDTLNAKAKEFVQEHCTEGTNQPGEVAIERFIGNDATQSFWVHPTDQDYGLDLMVTRERIECEVGFNMYPLKFPFRKFY